MKYSLYCGSNTYLNVEDDKIIIFNEKRNTSKYYRIVDLKSFEVHMPKSSFSNGVIRFSVGKAPDSALNIGWGVTLTSGGDEVLAFSYDFRNTAEKIQNYIANYGKILEKDAAPQLSVEHVPTIPVGFSVADELLKYKQLLDMDAITQEEFDIKKKELLALSPIGSPAAKGETKPLEPPIDPDAPKIVKLPPAPPRPKSAATTWICKHCKYENPISRKSCLNCGAPK